MLKIIKIIFLLSFASGVVAQELAIPSPLFDLSGQLPEIDPEVERRALGLPSLKSLDLEIGFYSGVMSVEDFGANYSYGADLVFHLTEDFFFQGAMSYSKITDEAFYRLNLPLFGTSRWRDVRTTEMAVGWNFLQGEMFWLDSLVLTSSAYVLLGGGTINFDNDNYFQIMTGMGIKFVPKDWLSLKAEAKFKEYESNLLGYKKYSHNFEYVFGLELNFW